MSLLLLSFLAGILTVLAPCVLPLLPVIIGGSVQGARKRNPYIITASLAVAIVLFTLFLKWSTLFINIPQGVWNTISGIILIAFGLISLFPRVWENLNVRFGFSNKSDELLHESSVSASRWSDVLIGLSLGPVFSSCSPTYFLILATVLPRSFATGLACLIAYAIGLSLVLLLVSVLGQRFIKKARWAVNPNGWFKRGLGVIFVLVGLLIFTGVNTALQAKLAANGFYPGSGLESSLIDRATSPLMPSSDATGTVMMPSSETQMKKNYPRYREIADPAGFVNATSVSLGNLIGKKVILLDFMTYSCINCIRTFPYLTAWDQKYRDQGLEIIGIHTPEFAFERNIDNVRAAMEKYGIKFPVVLDNTYGTWNAYSNNYWPRKYLIDIDGYIVYDHIGEGNDDEVEQKIQQLLQEKAIRDHAPAAMVPTGVVQLPEERSKMALSPETYFGSGRNQTLTNGKPGITGEQTLIVPSSIKQDALYLGGSWKMEDEYAESFRAGATVQYRYHANNLFFVASASKTPITVRVLRDGKPLDPAFAGEDIKIMNGQSTLTIQAERLYSVIRDPNAQSEHTLEFIIDQPGLRAYTFTFG